MSSSVPAGSGSTSRQVGFEWLRILAMLMVIGVHYGLYGGLLDTTERSGSNYVFTVVVKNLSGIAVNCYILLTGYFLCCRKFRCERVVMVYLQMAFYSLFFLALSWIVPLTAEPRAAAFFCSIFPFTAMQYWFVSSYLVLLLLSPFLNMVIRNATRRQFQLLLATLFLIVGILPSINRDIFAAGVRAKLPLFILLYFCGAYCQEYIRLEARRWKFFLGGYLGVTALNFVLLGVNFFTKKEYGIRPFACEDYLFVVTLAGALFFFLFWGCVRINAAGWLGKVILRLSPLAFGVYLFHDNPLFRDYLWHHIIRLDLYFKSPWYPLISIGVILGIYATGSAFDWIRLRLFTLLRLHERISGARWCRWLNACFDDASDSPGTSPRQL